MGKTILFDYSESDHLLPQVARAASCCQMTCVNQQRTTRRTSRDASGRQCARELV